MSDEILSEVLKRLKSIEERLDNIEKPQEEPVSPPPVIRRPARRIEYHEDLQFLSERSKRETSAPRKPVYKSPSVESQSEPTDSAVPKEPKEDQEFAFGSKVLPRVGMVIVLLAVFYLVALGIQRGAITLKVQFIGELLLCSGLVGVGLWKLKEREDFGQVLVGGGSCALYLSFAGANVYKIIDGDPLIGGEALVVLFALLSLANLAFSWWRSSKSFWMIGYVGGLVAAGLPMDKSDHGSTLVLAGIIVLAATILAARMQWFKALAGLWLVSGVFVFYVSQQAVQQGAMAIPGAIAVFYAFSFVPIAAHAMRFVPNKFDDKGWFFLSAGGLTALVTLTFGNDILPVPHSVSIVVWSVALLAIARYIRTKPHSEIIVYTGIGAATVIAPLGFTSFAASLTYAGLGLLATVVIKPLKKDIAKSGALISASFVVLTISAYVVAMASGPLGTAVELAMLGAIAIGMANVGYAAGKLDKGMSEAATLVATLFYPILVRAAFISASEERHAVLIASAVYVIVLSVVSIRAKWSGLGLLGMVISAIGTLIYWGSVVDAGTDSMREIIALMVLTTALVLSALGAGRGEKDRQLSTVVASVMGGFVVVPALYLMLRLPSIGLPLEHAVATSIVAYSIILGALSLVLKWPNQALVGTGAILVATIYYWSQIAGGQSLIGAGSQLFITVLMSSAVVILALGASHESKGRHIAWAGASVMGLFVLARVFFLVLRLPTIDLDYQTALLSSWAIYAILLAIASHRTKLHSIAVVSYSITLLSIGFFWNYWLQSSLQMSLGDQILTLGLQSTALVLGTLGVARSKDEQQNAAVLTSIIGWFVFAQLINVFLTLPAIGMAEEAALTTSWSIYSALALTLGFVFDFKNLRITSLVMFGITIAKVFIVDLASLDEMIRVLVLIVLGGLLLLAGYLYVRKRKGTGSSSDTV